MLLAFLHGERGLIGFLLGGVITIVGVPLLLYTWLWHTKVSELKLALGYFVFVMVLLCGLLALGPNSTTSIFRLTGFSISFILTLPWSALVGGVLIEIMSARNAVLDDREFAVVMMLAAGLNAVILYFIAVKMRRLIK